MVITEATLLRILRSAMFPDSWMRYEDIPPYILEALSDEGKSLVARYRDQQ